MAKDESESYGDFVKRTTASYDDEVIDDENTIDPKQVTPAEPQPVSDENAELDAQPVPQHPAHPVDEDPEDHIGDETADPWTDEDQDDWPNAHPADDTYAESDDNKGDNA